LNVSELPKGFGNHYPSQIEHYAYVPAYPKSHSNGFATVVELPDMMNGKPYKWTKEKIKALRQAMQYTLTASQGDKIIPHVEYFEIEGNEELDFPMNESYRKCAGVKVRNFNEHAANLYRLANFCLLIYMFLIQKLIRQNLSCGLNS